MADTKGKKPRPTGTKTVDPTLSTPRRKSAAGRANPAAIGVPASKRSLRNQGRETMRKLLDAAMEAIDQRGYHSTRVKDVVDIANTSHGTFYLYFSNKEDLVRALTLEATYESSKLLGAVTEAGSALDIESWDNLRQWIGDYSAVWTRYAPLFRSWTDLASIDQSIGDQNRRMVAAHIEGMASRIAASGPTGDLDPGVAGMAVVAMLDRFHFMREFMGTPVDDAALDTLTTMVHRALFTPPADHSAPPPRSDRATPGKAGGTKKKKRPSAQ